MTPATEKKIRDVLVKAFIDNGLTIDDNGQLNRTAAQERLLQLLETERRWLAEGPLTPDEIRALRKEARMSQTELSEALGVSFCTVNRWEQGHTRPGIEALVEIRKECAKAKAKAEANEC